MKKKNTKDAGFRAHFYKHLLCMNATETKKKLLNTIYWVLVQIAYFKYLVSETS